MGNKTNKPMHITVRGPYETPPNTEYLESLKDKLLGYGVIIGGGGTFKTKQGYAVYLPVKSPLFSEIWWKPDFKEDGINPHLTVYETKSKDAANLVEKFLKSERIEISTFSITLTSYTSKQQELFEETLSPEQLEKISMIERWRVKPGIIQRASAIRNQLNQLQGVSIN